MLRARALEARTLDDGQASCSGACAHQRAGFWCATLRPGFDFVTHIKATYFVTAEKARQQPAGDWLAAGGKATTLRNVTVTGTNAPIASFVAVKARDMKEPWFLVSSLGDAKGSELIERYGRRFTIEESFRDRLFRQRCDSYEFLPTMREAGAEPLVNKFYERLRAQPVFAEVLGII